MSFDKKFTVTSEMSPDELELKKEEIRSEIQKLGLVLEGLDNTIANHEAQKTVYADLSTDIESKQKIIELLTPDIKDLTDKKLSLEKEISNLQVTLDEKVELLKEIEQLKGMVKILQKEHVDFEADHAAKRKVAESHLQGTQEKLEFLYATIGSVIKQLK